MGVDDGLFKLTRPALNQPMEFLIIVRESAGSAFFKTTVID